MLLTREEIFRGVFQAIVVVVSILLAFGIDTWWTELEEKEEALALLSTFQVELAASIRLQEEELIFRIAKQQSAQRILAASTGDVELKSGEIDALINDVTHWGTQANVVGALSSLIDSGKLAWIDSTGLRAKLAQWPEKTALLDEIVRQDRDRLERVFYPYLMSRASFPKISNAWRGRPGDTEKTVYALEGGLLPDAIDTDHSTLLSQREFLSIVTMIFWDQADAILSGKEWLEEARQLSGEIQTNLAQR
ncbi:MAG: hypothetical protein GKR90_27125 [Pseudomonadales bacterium]|nr:hypothetical protein [Pseudomonadales bacterium]